MAPNEVHNEGGGVSGGGQGQEFLKKGKKKGRVGRENDRVKMKRLFEMRTGGMKMCWYDYGHNNRGKKP